MTSYRGRLAPSPTGYLHLGHARTFCVAAKRAAGGILILRDEDLDPDRTRPHYRDAMLEDLRWLGLSWQEGPDVGGPHGPYRQSERHSFYHKAWEQLLRQGSIYPCRCSRKDLAQAMQAPHDDEGIYPGTCRPIAPRLVSGRGSRLVSGHNISRAEKSVKNVGFSPGGYPNPVAVSGLTSSFSEWTIGHNWRFRVPDGEIITFIDGHFGRQGFEAGKDFGDFLVWRRDGLPSYQLAVVSDDAAMKITEVVRGRDLLLSTARQILLARALGLPSPAWYHCDLMLDERGERLAKRHDSLSLRTLREQGKRAEEVLATLHISE